MASYIVLRRSPDWPTFDLFQTRQFCADIGLDQNSIIDYAEEWNAEVEVDFLSYRQSIKEIALSCVYSVRNAIVISHEALSSIEFVDDDLIYFTDDDDWVSPDLFDRLSSSDTNRDGWIWPSLAVRKPFHEQDNETVLLRRPISS